MKELSAIEITDINSDSRDTIGHICSYRICAAVNLWPHTRTVSVYAPDKSRFYLIPSSWEIEPKSEEHIIEDLF